jgi:cytochrome P450
MSHVHKTCNTPEGMHIEEIKQTWNVFAIAGSETTATLLSGVTYLSLKNPPVYQKLVNEIRQTFSMEEKITFSKR